MANIRNFGFLAQLRSDASHHILSYQKGKLRKSGRGLVFWFAPENTSIAELPLDDRELSIFVNGRSADFQKVTTQGMLTWRVVDPELLAERINFNIHLGTGLPTEKPIERIETRIVGMLSQIILQYLAGLDVRAALDAGLNPLRAEIEQALAADQTLAEIGLAVIAVRLDKLAPSSELERALQTPTFEALQQKADQAMFERRALAVDKERAIAENELANKIELARREKQLIAEDAQNTLDRAKGEAEAQKIAADGEADRIRAVEMAKAEAETAHMAVFRDLPANVLLALAARDLATKLTHIDQVNVTPDMLASLVREFRGADALPALGGR